MYIFAQEMFGSAPLYDVLTSCTKSSYTPSGNTEYPKRVKIAENLIGYAKKKKKKEKKKKIILEYSHILTNNCLALGHY